ncbi:unnamed protein product [Brachionus calyciflorus]|uniref:CHHC U11-48K-type domain-containing protein n=1 Tax=Brachionus calyciflorus TaxID=104777 RepID=A0A814MY36_9BILA|nr:unnamed protein product [Brachionus calyciflorus]
MEEELIVCPFDPNHKVRSSRFESHIIKCKKQYANLGIDVCPFNAKHVTPRSQIRTHIATCPDRTRLIYESSLSQNFNRTDQINLENNYSRSSTFDDPFGNEENWDNEVCQTNTVLPKEPLRSVGASYAVLAPKQRKQLRISVVEEFKKNTEQKLEKREN